VAIIVTPFSVLSIFALPKRVQGQRDSKRKLDWQGVVALGGGLILFVYAISDGNDAGKDITIDQSTWMLTLCL